MSENLNSNSESLTVSSNYSSWDELAEVPFDGYGSEVSEPARVEPAMELDGVTAGLQAIESAQTEEAYRPVGEMETSEVAREYMDLLQDLSSNFTSPEGIQSAVINPDGTVRDRRGYDGDKTFVKDLYKKNGLELDETNNFDKLRENDQNTLAELHYENNDLDRAHTLKMVDSILSGEQAWRDAGKEYAEVQSTLTSAIEKLNQLQVERQSQGFFNRIANTLSFRKQTKEINAIIDKAKADLLHAERESQNSNHALTAALEAAYSEDYHYGHHQLSYEHRKDQDYQEQINEDYNNRFFGVEDPARQDKINRALELRQALELK